MKIKTEKEMNKLTKKYIKRKHEKEEKRRNKITIYDKILARKVYKYIKQKTKEGEYNAKFRFHDFKQINIEGVDKILQKKGYKTKIENLDTIITLEVSWE